MPIIPDASGMTPFHLVQKLRLNVLLDEMMEHLRFSRLINEQETVKQILKQGDPNLIKFVESSLEETQASSKIKSIHMPVLKEIITFRSD